MKKPQDYTPEEVKMMLELIGGAYDVMAIFFELDFGTRIKWLKQWREKANKLGIFSEV